MNPQSTGFCFSPRFGNLQVQLRKSPLPRDNGNSSFGVSPSMNMLNRNYICTNTPGSHRPNPQASSVIVVNYATNVCRCHRPLQIVMCSSCGHTFHGRVRSTCPAHPNSIYLMDINHCPNCCCERLVEYSICAPKK